MEPQNEPQDQPFIPCLNFCRTDPQTGYCQTCGRPPVPVSNIDLARPSFAGIDLAKLKPSGSSS